MRILGVFLALQALLAVPALAQTAADCVTLAGALSDAPDPEALEAAQEACSAAVRQQPDSTELLHLYARTLEVAGDREGATRLYQWAAEGGYAPAAEALARLAGEPTETEPADGADEPHPADAEDLAGEATPAEAAEEAPAAETEPVEPADAALAGTADALDQLARLLEQARRLLPRTTFDPAAVVAEVDTDPEMLTRWVGSQTVLVPYRGRLRGPVGALMDRFGNSLDRALLLAALLEEAGHDPVLVHGSLSEADAGSLLAVKPEPPAPTGEGRSREALLAELGVDPATDPLGLARAMEAGAREGAAAREALAATTRAQGDALLALVAGAARPAGSRAQELSALADHWWVRLRPADGSVRDLDPSGVSGSATEIETLAVAELPPELSHAIALVVVAELLEADGSLRSETLLSHRFLPADLTGTPVMLWNEPIGLSGAGELMASGDVAAIRQALLDERSWQPALKVGDEVFADRIVTVDGSILDGSSEGLAAARLPYEGFSATMVDLFSGMAIPGGEEPEEPPPAAAQLVGLWLEFTITAPGMEPIHHRRAMVDLVGASARANAGPFQVAVDDAARLARTEGLLEQVDLGIFGATPSSTFLADITARDLAPLFALVAGQLRQGPDGAVAFPSFAEADRSQILPYGFAAGRTGLSGTTPVVIAHPNLMLLRQGTRLSGAGPSTAYAMVDIVENGVAQVGAPPSGAFAARLRQGVADTALESVVLGSPEPSRNASALFAADLAADRSWVLFSRPEDIGAADLPPDVTAQIASALADGHVAVAPADPSGGLVAWWRVDPVTGTTLGMSATGTGSEFVEYLTLLGKVIGLAGCVVGGYDAAQNVTSTGGAVATGAAYAVCVLGASLSILSSFAKILFVTTPMTEAAIAANAAAWAAPDAIGALAGAGSGLVLGILGL